MTAIPTNRHADTSPPHGGALSTILGNLAPGRIHLLTGGAGAGKSAVALQFVADGLARGEQCVMFTAAHGDDVKALAATLGIRVNDALRARRLHLLRWRSLVHRELGHVTAVQRVVEDMRGLIRVARARRVVVDSFAPLFGDGLGAELLVESLDAIGATSILTLAERIDLGYDRWLEPVVQCAAAVVQLRRRGAAMEFECHSRRGAPALRERGRFVIAAGRGLVPAGARRTNERVPLAVAGITDPAGSLLMTPADLPVPRTPDVEA